MEIVKNKGLNICYMGNIIFKIVEDQNGWELEIIRKEVKEKLSYTEHIELCLWKVKRILKVIVNQRDGCNWSSPCDIPINEDQRFLNSLEHALNKSKEELANNLNKHKSRNKSFIDTSFF